MRWYIGKVREGKNLLFSRKGSCFQIEGLLIVFFQSIWRFILTLMGIQWVWNISFYTLSIFNEWLNGWLQNSDLWVKEILRVKGSVLWLKLVHESSALQDALQTEIQHLWLSCRFIKRIKQRPGCCQCPQVMAHTFQVEKKSLDSLYCTKDNRVLTQTSKNY